MNISMSTNESTRMHEAAHCAAAIWFGGRSIRCVRVDWPDVDVPGETTVERERDLRPEDLIIRLVGWMEDGECPGAWPPPWPVAEDSAEGVGVLVKHLGLDEAGYREIVALAEKLLADPDFQRLQGLIARALHIAPVIDGESVEILRKAAGIPEPQLEGKGS
jgi:hypothetical protein